jgi:hypothetical protein
MHKAMHCVMQQDPAITSFWLGDIKILVSGNLISRSKTYSCPWPAQRSISSEHHLQESLDNRQNPGREGLDALACGLVPLRSRACPSQGALGECRSRGGVARVVQLIPLISLGQPAPVPPHGLFPFLTPTAHSPPRAALHRTRQRRDSKKQTATLGTILGRVYHHFARRNPSPNSLCVNRQRLPHLAISLSPADAAVNRSNPALDVSS